MATMARKKIQELPAGPAEAAEERDRAREEQQARLAALTEDDAASRRERLDLLAHP